VVYVVPYRDAATVRLIEDAFYAANQKALGLKSRREITTHLLSTEQQSSRSLDFVSGFELVDPEGRIYILEGLRNGAIQEFHAKMTRKAPNSKDFKIFKNSSISFSARLFAAFHLELKRVILPTCRSDYGPLSHSFCSNPAYTSKAKSQRRSV
jgi:hypothetical protein